jgi:hypothetical protein
MTSEEASTIEDIMKIYFKAYADLIEKVSFK